MNPAIYTFTAVIEPVPNKHGAFVRFPHDVRQEFGKGRVKVRAVFDGAPYEGSLVNMGVKNPDGSTTATNTNKTTGRVRLLYHRRPEGHPSENRKGPRRRRRRDGPGTAIRRRTG